VSRAGIPSHADIAGTNRALVATLANVTADLTACWTCWACGIQCTPERAHVLARSQGGSDAPENFFLLCAVCHREQPDGAPRAAQVAWLRAREHHTQRAHPQLEAAVRECARLGGETALAVWWHAIGAEGVQRILGEGYKRAAANDLATMRANAASALIEAFTAWLPEYARVRAELDAAKALFADEPHPLPHPRARAVRA
jgi:hypothetical protein